MEINSQKLKDNPVGFFPPFVNLSESGRIILIAKRYREMGGNPIVFSNGGKYEFLAEKNGFNLIRLEPIISEKLVENYFKVVSGERVKSNEFLDEKWLYDSVKGQIAAFKKTNIKLLVSANNATCSISAKASNIPYINVVPCCGPCAIKIPEDLENPFTILVPQFIKKRILNWVFMHSKRYLKTINNVVKKFGAQPFKYSYMLFKADITFITGFPEFLDVFPLPIKIDENWIGMISLNELFEDEMQTKEAIRIDGKIKNHLKRPGKSILVSLGSSGTTEVFKSILDTLDGTEFNVIAIHSLILNENLQSKYNDNILLLKFVPSIERLNELVDLAIIHGGQGTVYTAAYAKKPVIGIPMHIEQHNNLERIVGHGMGLMLSKKNFSKKRLLNAIDEIFSNYDKYHNNAIKLGNKLPPFEGDKKAAKRIAEIVNSLV